MSSRPRPPDRGGGGGKEPPESLEPTPSGLWRAVLEALESNTKTARLIAIILACALTAAIVRTFR